MLVSLPAAGAMALTALGMVLAPGPNMMYLVSRSISQGRTAGLISLAGTCAGFLIYMVAANVGLAAIFILVPWLYIGFKAVGAAYIAYLAYQMLKPGGHGLFEARQLPRDSASKLFRMGLITNLLNPKAAIMYLALIPQFIVPAHGAVALQGLELGLIQIAVSMTVNATIVVAAGTIATFIATRPRWARFQRRASGTLLGVVALLLVREVPERARV